jgi:hypothetical protein
MQGRAQIKHNSTINGSFFQLCRRNKLYFPVRFWLHNNQLPQESMDNVLFPLVLNLAYGGLCPQITVDVSGLIPMILTESNEKDLFQNLIDLISGVIQKSRKVK